MCQQKSARSPEEGVPACFSQVDSKIHLRFRPGYVLQSVTL